MFFPTHEDNLGPTFDKNVNSIIFQSFGTFDKSPKLRLSITVRSITICSIILHGSLI
jgi:hypothetical protein